MPTGVDDQIGRPTPRRVRTVREAENSRDGRARAVGIDDRNVRTRQVPAQGRGEQPDHPAADHHDLVAGRRPRVPDDVHRGLHVGGQHGAGRRHALRDRVDRFGGHTVAILVWIQTEDRPAHQPIRPLVDDPDAAVAVLDRTGNSPSWNGARIAACCDGGTAPRKTSASVPRLMPL